jgi:hypothetical protein
MPAKANNRHLCCIFPIPASLELCGHRREVLPSFSKLPVRAATEFNGAELFLIANKCSRALIPVFYGFTLVKSASAAAEHQRAEAEALKFQKTAKQSSYYRCNIYYGKNCACHEGPILFVFDAV